MLLASWFLLIGPFAVQATTISLCVVDRDSYAQGDTGYLEVAILNDAEDKIRITDLAATINYYYADGTAYVQKFDTNATLPYEIPQGDSSTLYIPFSLPTNIAAGYAKVDVKAVTELWNLQAARWGASDHLTYQLRLYVESPYKQQFEDQLATNDLLEEQLDEEIAANDQLQTQLEEQLAINTDATNMMYLFGATTAVFAAVAGLLFMLYRRTRVFRRPIA
jgi:hypothetical protein